jgi:predicted metal-dependent peptidase
MTPAISAHVASAAPPVQRRQASQPTAAQSLKARELMGKAKAALILEQPFFATIICNCPMIEDNSLPTMATNGEFFKYNSVFICELPFDQLKGVLAHEAMHCVHQHMFRRGERDPRRWNQAGDYVINDLLTQEGFALPDGALINRQLVIAGGGMTEGVYDLLPDGSGGSGSQPGSGGSGSSQPDDHGDPMDDCLDQDGSPAEQSAKEAEMKVRVAQAAQAAKMCGKLSAGMARFVEEALTPKVDWRDVLRRFVSARAKVDMSYARPKRRFAAEDLYLPSLSGERMGEIVVAVDCSGSIGPRELSEFAAEIAAIKADVPPTRMHVVYFDSEISHHDVYEADDEPVIAPHGGGGTAFSPIFKHISDAGIDPACTVVLTDLYCDDFGDVPGYPVLWVTTGSDRAPWGDVVKMNRN